MNHRTFAPIQNREAGFSIVTLLVACAITSILLKQMTSLTVMGANGASYVNGSMAISDKFNEVRLILSQRRLCGCNLGNGRTATESSTSSLQITKSDLRLYDANCTSGSTILAAGSPLGATGYNVDDINLNEFFKLDATSYTAKLKIGLSKSRGGIGSAQIHKSFLLHFNTSTSSGIVTFNDCGMSVDNTTIDPSPSPIATPTANDGWKLTMMVQGDLTDWPPSHLTDLEGMYSGSSTNCQSIITVKQSNFGTNASTNTRGLCTADVLSYKANGNRIFLNGKTEMYINGGNAKATIYIDIFDRTSNTWIAPPSWNWVYATIISAPGQTLAGGMLGHLNTMIWVTKGHVIELRFRLQVDDYNNNFMSGKTVQIMPWHHKVVISDYNNPYGEQ